MNNTSETEVTAKITSSWVAEWICPNCHGPNMSCECGLHTCMCGTRFNIRKQPYASKTPVYVVMISSRQTQPWPAYEVK